MTPGMNLLPTSYRVRCLCLTIARRWLGLTIILILLTCLWGLQDVLQSQEARETMIQLRRTSDPIRTRQAESRLLRERLVQLREQKTLESQLAERRPITDLMGIIARASKVCQGEICVRKLELRQDAGAGVAPAYRLFLVGVGVNDLAVAQFAASLRDSEAFSRVHLTSTSPITENDIAARSFALECSY